MNAVIVACRTLKDEIDLALAESGVNYPVIWIESGLHNYPDRLRTKIQEMIDRIDHVDYIIMAFGYCGNSLEGISSPVARLVIPRIDDCISLLLGSCQNRVEIFKKNPSYFVTRGWIENENNIHEDYRRCVVKYGIERTKRIMKLMLGNYKYWTLIDTGAYPLDQNLAVSEAMAGDLGLAHQVISGSLDYLKQTFTGPWDDEHFLVLPPGRPVTMGELLLGHQPVNSNIIPMGQ